MGEGIARTKGNNGCGAQTRSEWNKRAPKGESPLYETLVKTNETGDADEMNTAK